MKLPSVRNMVGAARHTFVRFPFSILSAILGSGAIIAILEWEIREVSRWYALNNVFIAASLGIALFAACVFAGERAGLGRGRLVALQGILAVLLVAYGLTLPHDIYGPPFIFGIRHWLLLLGAHLLVAFSAFTRRGETQGFWQFNRALFLRLLVALLYTCVLFAGLSIALAAVNNLFELSIRGERYMQLWVFLMGVFNTWFFFSGVPERLDELEADSSYPRGLKLFTQYVLLPLVVVYLVILYAYVAKILVTWDWPKGWVANLVLGFSITGIFSLLLIHPLVHRGEERWIFRFSRWFYFAEVPLVVVLLLAIGRRVQDYGVTENRYFVVVMGLWLAVMTVYFLFKKSASIKVIPASLCILSFVVTVGPWSAFSVSEHSQLSRLAARLTANRILVDGKVVRTSTEVTSEDAKEISSVVDYVLDVHGPASLQPWFDWSLDSLWASEAPRASRYDRAATKKILIAMGLKYVPDYQNGPGFRMFAARRPAPIPFDGPVLALHGICVGRGAQVMSVRLDEGPVNLSLKDNDLIFALSRMPGKLDTLRIGLLERSRELYADTSLIRADSLPVHRMMIHANGLGMDMMLAATRIDVSVGAGTFSVLYVEGDLFIERRVPPKK